MKLNADVLEAIRRAIDYYGNTAQFAKKIGVAHSTVLFWLSGKTRNISGTVWDNKVRRVLRQFQPDSHTVQDPRGPYLSQPASDPKTAPKTAPASLPAVEFSKMTWVDTTLQSPVSFARDRGSDECPFSEIRPDSDFLVILDRPDLCPGLPVGARLLVSCGSYAQDGDIVIGKTRQPARLFLCRCSRSDDRIRLTPLDPEAPEMEWLYQDNAEKVFWIFPVRKILIDLEDHRWVGSALVPAKKDEAGS